MVKTSEIIEILNCLYTVIEMGALLDVSEVVLREKMLRRAKDLIDVLAAGESDESH